MKRKGRGKAKANEWAAVMCENTPYIDKHGVMLYGRF